MTWRRLLWFIPPAFPLRGRPSKGLMGFTACTPSGCAMAIRKNVFPNQSSMIAVLVFIFAPFMTACGANIKKGNNRGNPLKNPAFVGLG